MVNRYKTLIEKFKIKCYLNFTVSLQDRLICLLVTFEFQSLIGVIYYTFNMMHHYKLEFNLIIFINILHLVHKYLLAAAEIVCMAGIKPITKKVITKSLAPDLASIEARLARSCYSFSAICELLNASAQEVRDFLLEKAQSSRKSEFLNIIRSIHISV